MARFLLKSEFKLGDEVELSPQESHHLAKVLRMEPGEECELVNGLGTLARAVIRDNHPKKARLALLTLTQEPRRNRIHLAFAIPKSIALDFIFHRCTELGVASFQPLLSAHSMKSSSWNEARWERIIHETAKQCQEVYFPSVLPPLPLKDWLTAKRDPSRTLFYCDENVRREDPSTTKTEPQQEKPTSDTSFQENKSHPESDLLIGSEGGWSDSERILFSQVGKPMGLGKNRLRAETACLIALTLLKTRFKEI